jgi:hypothetical protein
MCDWKFRDGLVVIYFSHFRTSIFRQRKRDIRKQTHEYMHRYRDKEIYMIRDSFPKFSCPKLQVHELHK